MTRRCLIAGCGDVGTRLGLLLAQRGIESFGLRRTPDALPSPIQPVRADLGDVASLEQLPAGIDTLVFTAAAAQRDAPTYRRTYLNGLANVVAAIRRGGALRRIVFVSSASVWGDCAGAWVDEATPCVPDGFNGQVLLEAEQWLAVQPESSSVLRLAGIYGPGRGAMLRRARHGGECVATPVNWTNRIHVDDAAAALAHLLALGDAAPAVVIGVDDRPAPLFEVLTWLAGQLGVAPPLAVQGDAGVGNKRLSNARLRATGYVPRFPGYVEGYGELLAGGAAARE